MQSKVYDLHLRQLNKTIELRGSVLSIFTSRQKLYAPKGKTEMIPSCLVVSSYLKKLPYKTRTEIVPYCLAVTVSLCEVGRVKIKWDNLCPAFICRFFQTRLHSKTWCDDFCIAFLCMELHKWTHNIFLLMKIVGKTTPQNSILILNQISYLLFFITFVCETKNANVFEPMFSWEKQPLWTFLTIRFS